jgi:hypothetical protein
MLFKVQGSLYIFLLPTLYQSVTFFFLISMLLPSTFISYVGSGSLAGGFVACPVLTSNLEPCQGHST